MILLALYVVSVCRGELNEMQTSRFTDAYLWSFENYSIRVLWFNNLPSMEYIGSTVLLYKNSTAVPSYFKNQISVKLMKCTLVQTFDPSSPTRTNSTQLVWVSGKSPNRWKIDIDLIFVCWYLYSCYTRVEKHKTRREGKQITLTPPQLHTILTGRSFPRTYTAAARMGVTVWGQGMARQGWNEQRTHGAILTLWQLLKTTPYVTRWGIFFSLRWTSSERWWCTELRRAQK